MQRPHDKIIADAAKVALHPLGFRRKGQSRIWFADHDWWMTVVEFQPSSWSKGTYLNVAGHWLWSEVDNFSFDFGGRVHEHEEYLSNVQFSAVASKLAEMAANEAGRLVRLFKSLEATAEVLLLEEARAGERHRGGWTTYNAGVAAALVGRTDTAIEMFGRVLNGFAMPGSVLRLKAEQMAQLAMDAVQFKHEVYALVSQHRSELKLGALKQ